MKQELLKNAIIVGLGRVFTQFSSLLLIPLFTLYLSPEEYGVIELIITYVALALPFVTLSLEQGAFRLLVDARNDTDRVTGIVTYLASKVGLLLLIASGVLVLVGSLFQIDYIAIILFYAVATILMNVCLWLARGFGDNSGYSKGSVVIGVTLLTSSALTVVVYKLGLPGVLLAYGVSSFVGVIYFTFRLRLLRYIKKGYANSVLSRELLQYSLPLIPNSVSWWLVNAADKTIIALALGASATGIFAVAAKFPAILAGLFAIFWIAWHESASLYINHEDRDDFFSSVTTSTIVLFGSIGLGILAALSLVFNYIVGAEFKEAYVYIPILMLGALLHAVATLYGSVYAAKKHTDQILYTTMAAAVVNIVLVLTLVYFIGLYAAAIASVVSYSIMVVYRHYDLRKHVRINIRTVSILPLVAMSIISITLFYVNHPFLNIVNFFFIVTLSVFVNRKILKSMKEMLWQKFARQS